MPFGINVPTAFGAQIYLHVVVLTSREVGVKKLNIVCTTMNRSVAEMTVQHVQKA